ncbi:hypothetical protein niasHT_027750 [Heterodera trifolii]|uniref:Caspase n=1 Tax=Heterodera trifolii TaxID=157864 RepID=A0ABD2KJ87_9BILA
MKYDSRFGDAFWNSSEQSYFRHGLRRRPNSNVAWVRDGKFEELVVRVRNALTRRKRPKIDSLRDRRWSNIDVVRFSKLMREFGYDVFEEVDHTKQQMVEALKNFSKHKGHEKADSCVLMIMTHGHYDQIYGVDDRGIDTREFVALLDGDKCPALRDKPKLVFVQACHGCTFIIFHNNRRVRKAEGAKDLWRCAVDERTVPDNQAAMPQSTRRALPNNVANRNRGAMPQAKNSALPTTWPIEIEEQSQKRQEEHIQTTWRTETVGPVLEQLRPSDTEDGLFDRTRHFCTFCVVDGPQVRTYFVESLFEMLSKKACQEDILDVMTRVNDLVGKLCAGPPDHQMQTPVVEYTLRKQFFNPVEETIY